MRRGIAAWLLAAGAVAGLGTPAAVAQKPKTTWDGVYSAAQAARGQELYTTTCAGCHKPDLTGDESLKPSAAPPLIAKELALSFNDLTIDALADRIRTTMPKDKPNTLTPEQSADVIAFLLSKGGMPAGPSDLPSATAAQKDITFVALKP